MQKIRFIFLGTLVLISALVIYKIPTNLGLDLQGGMQILLEAKDTPTVKVDQDSILGSMEVIRSRIDSLGLTEPIIQRKGTNQIVVELPGIKDTDRAMGLIGETALLEFVEAEWAPQGIENLPPEKQQILIGENGRLTVLEDKDEKGRIIRSTPIILKQTLLNGSDLKHASPGTNQTGDPIVNIEFNSAGAQKFYDVTRTHIGKPLAILLDGKIISAPNIQEPIAGGRAQISGHFSIKEMKDLVIKLKAGALPVPIEIVSHKIVGPTLGKDSIEKSKIACIIAFSAVCLFMALMYQIPGLVACLALSTYVILAFAVIKLFHATLTLTGIAGLILTIGIAVDANVITFERIKEERKKGLDIIQAIQTGFAESFRTIFDSNVTTLIASAVLFAFGTGSIRGFAITLSIGILVSMFTAIFVTKLLLISLMKLRKNSTYIFKGNI